MKNLGWFLAAFTLVLGPLLTAAPSWEWFATPIGVGALFSAISGVLGAAYGVTIPRVKGPFDPSVN